MKIAVSGKGGVGKTTFAGILARLLGMEGKRVLCIDADPSANLALTLGISREEREKIVPLSKMQDLIEERTGAKPGVYGAMFSLNPKVDDLPAKFSVRARDNVRLLVLGSIKAGGTGCFCPENALLRRLIKHLVLRSDEVLIMDMEAGIEHLARGTAESIELMVIVVEPGLKSVETARQIKMLASDIGIPKVAGIINKSFSDDKRIIKEMESAGIPVLGTIPYIRAMVNADINGTSPFEFDGTEKVINAVRKIKDRIEDALSSHP